jgi:hypothetical protein
MISTNMEINIYRSIILSVVLYGCESWSLTLREERRLRVSGNRRLRRNFGPKRDEATEEWRKLHNEGLYNLFTEYCSVVKLRGMTWASHVARMDERRDVYRNMVGKPKEKKALGKLRRRWKDNIKMDFQKFRWKHGLN